MLDLTGAEAEVRAAAEAYCRALCSSDARALEGIFHEVSHLYASQDGDLIAWPRQVFLDRVASREPGPEKFEILSVHAAGPEMATVTLSVTAGPRQFTDYLNFLKLDGEWRVIAKLFRVEEGPAI